MKTTASIPLVSIVSVNFRQREVTADLLKSLDSVNYPNLEIILVDNGSEEDNTLFFKAASQHNIEVIISKENLGFAGGTNLGIRHSNGDLVLLLNNDTIVSPDFLNPMVELIQSKENIGMVCPKIYFYDYPNVIQYAGATRIHSLSGRGSKIGYRQRDNGKFQNTGPTELGNGACMLVRRKLLEEVGLLSEMYFMYYEEHDLTERARKAGWEIYYTGASYIHHKQSISIGKQNPLKVYYQSRNRVLYMRRFSKGLLLFLLYFLLIGAPKSMIQHLSRGEFIHAKQIIRGIWWNLFHYKIQYRHEGINW